MPELPEVETVAHQLRVVIVGKTISNIEVCKAKSWSGDKGYVLGQTITDVTRRSKILRIILKNGQSLLVHLKMSGQLIFVDGEKRVGGGHPTTDWINELPSKHTRIIFTFSDGTHLYFNDQRIFGWVRLASEEEVQKTFAPLAPDIIDPAVTSEYLFKKSRNKRIPIKQFIMDNQIISGVGNIYANDALNLAKISPLRATGSLSREEMDRLLESMKIVIDLGIQHGGATADGKYVHVSGLAGKYQNVMRVYSKKGQPCPNCGNEIVKVKLGGRGTFYCPTCQV
jgi:formamidopyrimidine-DNA glycosylase